MTKHYDPYSGYPYAGQTPQQGYGQTPYQTPYQQQNSNTHFISGLIAGAAVAYLASNKKVQQGVAATGTKVWSTVRGEVEELKERLEDTQAELEYYRNMHKDK
ncbi:YtxH domain-containing protein [Ferrimonas lipolytica]|uniref:YtxH domain-containing protein n=1 Tax=Ferrimonas lipolytica TaxID=2724191 RepID=A0A6H1UAY2_9GAMM|nr:YtxH domain-containing protein [Ferrimonas lipolytica]QIZ76225.1 YtxH domain-containing protein [Ferrimonas lipolytica]